MDREETRNLINAKMGSQEVYYKVTRGDPVVIMIRASTTMDLVHNRLLVYQRLDAMKTALEPVGFEDFETKPLEYLLSFSSTSPMIFKQSVSSMATTSSVLTHPD